MIADHARGIVRARGIDARRGTVHPKVEANRLAMANADPKEIVHPKDEASRLATANVAPRETVRAMASDVRKRIVRATANANRNRARKVVRRAVKKTRSHATRRSAGSIGHSDWNST